MVNKNSIEKLVSFLGENKESYFVIGGNAAALHFESVGLSFRATEDFDIVLVTKIDNSDFASQIAKFLIEGGYENKYRNEKKTAYRFEKPKSPNYPKVIEFFVKEGEFPESLDKRLAKVGIEVNEEKISAIVLDSDVYEFAKSHVIYDYDLPVVDIKGLIALKTLAYFKNLELHKQGFVDSDDYIKHKKDVFRLLTIITDSEPLEDLPEILQKSLYEYLPILEKSNDLARNYKANLKNIVERYKIIAKL